MKTREARACTQTIKTLIAPIFARRFKILFEFSCHVCNCQKTILATVAAQKIACIRRLYFTCSPNKFSFSFLGAKMTSFGHAACRGSHWMKNPQCFCYEQMVRAKAPTCKSVPLRCQRSVFLVQNPRQSRPGALLEGSENFRESAFSGTFSSPHTFCTPPYHGWSVSSLLRE